MRRRLLLGFVVVGALVWAGNRRWVAPETPRAPRLLAHRGLAQEYDREGLTGETCTAARMLPPRHAYLENTVASIEAAFALGADRVELDIHPTTDGHFVVFHDWTLDCRTDGTGVTRDHTLAELQALDVGYGYTADGGRTFPFRGQGVGQMPSLDEVLALLQDERADRRLLLNVKSDSAEEANQLVERLATLPAAQRDRLAVSGGDTPTAIVRERLGLRTLSRGRLKACLLRYAAVGWLGVVPADCEHTLLLVPVNAAPWLWGWPYRFVDRLHAADAEVYVIGPWHGGWSDGLDDPADLARLPADFEGGISTDQLDRIAPLLGR